MSQWWVWANVKVADNMFSIVTNYIFLYTSPSMMVDQKDILGKYLKPHPRKGFMIGSFVDLSPVAHHQNPVARSGRNAPQERASLWQPFLRQTPSVGLHLSADDKKNDKQSLCLIWLKCNVYCVYHTWHFHTCPYIPVHSSTFPFHCIILITSIPIPVGGLEHFLCSIIYGMSSFPLTNSIIFQDG